MEGPSTNGKRFMSQINVTPLVDVMLVLLIIFMVTAPMMQEGVDVNLPRVEASSVDNRDEPLIVTVDRSRRFYINSKPVKLSELKAKLSAISRGAEKTVLLRADESLPYGYVMSAMSEVRKAGITKVGLVTEPIQRSE